MHKWLCGILAIFIAVIYFNLYYAADARIPSQGMEYTQETLRFSSKCKKFELVSNSEMDLLIKSGTPHCKATKWAGYQVYLTSLSSRFGLFPIVVYSNSDKPSSFIVHIHGGPRKMVGLYDPMLIYGKMPQNISFVRPTYSGSLNRTNYPSVDLYQALDEINETLRSVRLSGLSLLLSADSAGAPLVERVCQQKCAEKRIYIAPMLLSPHDTSISNFRNSKICLSYKPPKECTNQNISLDRLHIFDRMSGNKMEYNSNGTYKIKPIELDGDRQLHAFYGDREYKLEQPVLYYNGKCPDIIYDRKDSIIGVNFIKSATASKCDNQLHVIENFRHPTFERMTTGATLYWQIASERLRAGS